MKMLFTRRVFLALLLLSVGGCGSRGNQRYIPSATAARGAVETALATWKSGTPYGPITTSKPAINVFDARWQAGTPLESFEILEEITGQEHPQFKVKMIVKGLPEETLTYLVVGIDPLLVFRDADYKKTTGM